MEIAKTKNGSTLEVALTGRLDTTTAPQLEESVMPELDDVTELIFDFAKLDYISSAGLRVMLTSQKAMNKKGTMKIKNVSEDIMEVFTITGFTDILTIE